ncbi:hypothetical protein M8S61_08235 [Enterobacter asburiae]|uniref:hypothetical protein n=1 Tax=Enterobacter asburiae TaxID=61645 RepID=UPI002074AEEC|nr:hypothetical protein [Enterobacter asburiae]MCM7687629.1 hypothetical protein [Enterobacter asburiae]
MQEQHFSHVNELLAMAPLNADGDRQLFKSQQVQLNVQGLVQWDFILHDGADWHFTQNAPMLSSEEQLKAFKEYIRQHLKRIIEQRSEQAR